jgi:hypothetical protein
MTRAGGRGGPPRHWRRVIVVRVDSDRIIVELPHGLAPAENHLSEIAIVDGDLVARDLVFVVNLT